MISIKIERKIKMSIILNKPSKSFTAMTNYVYGAVSKFDEHMEGWKASNYSAGSYVNWYFEKDGKEIVVTVREYEIK